MKPFFTLAQGPTVNVHVYKLRDYLAIANVYTRQISWTGWIFSRLFSSSFYSKHVNAHLWLHKRKNGFFVPKVSRKITTC